MRQEASRLGGIGSCGRELCCSTWLTDFKTVSTSAARYQNLSLNPSKLSGQCGRLKCCLNYELDTYLDALKGIPEVETPLKTAMGNAALQKTDIFKRIMWFGFQDETTWFPLPVERVVEIIEMNKAGKTPATLESNEVLIKDDRIMIREKEELSRFDDKFKSKNKKRNKKKRSPSDDASDRTQRPAVTIQRPASNQQQQPHMERENNTASTPRPIESSSSRPQRVSPSPEQSNDTPRNDNQRREDNTNRPAQGNRPQRSNQPNNNSDQQNKQQNTRPPRQGNQGNNESKPQSQQRNNENRKPQENKNQGGNKHQITKKPSANTNEGENKPFETKPSGNFPPRQNSEQHPKEGPSQNDSAN